jgi:hypothetical protein
MLTLPSGFKKQREFADQGLVVLMSLPVSAAVTESLFTDLLLLDDDNAITMMPCKTGLNTS